VSVTSYRYFIHCYSGYKIFILRVWIWWNFSFRRCFFDFIPDLCT